MKNRPSNRASRESRARSQVRSSSSMPQVWSMTIGGSSRFRTSIARPVWPQFYGFDLGITAKAGKLKVTSSSVAHALMRAVSALMPTPANTRSHPSVERSLDAARMSACATRPAPP